MMIMLDKENDNGPNNILKQATFDRNGMVMTGMVFCALRNRTIFATGSRGQQNLKLTTSYQTFQSLCTTIAQKSCS